MNLTRKPKSPASPPRTALAAVVWACVFGQTGCSSVSKVFATDPGKEEQPPINNPFGEDFAKATPGDRNQGVIFRTRQGDRAVEVEVPKTSRELSEFVIPINPAFNGSRGRAPASVTVMGEAGTYSSDGQDAATGLAPRKSSLADREITSTFPQGTPELSLRRNEVENTLGVVPAEEHAPDVDSSYLAGVDRTKQLYRAGRFEAALLENDQLLMLYPTDPKLYEMRGTLLERVGKSELALRAWQQSLRLDPSNESLKRFIERKQARLPANTGKGSQP